MACDPSRAPVHAMGIVGAGKLGRTLASLAQSAGFKAIVAGSGPSVRTQRVLDTFAPGTSAGTLEQVTGADIVVLAVALSDVAGLDPADFAGRIVVDPTNYWFESDGERYDNTAEPTSVSVQHHLAESRVVKAFSHVAYKDLAARPSTHRIAMGIASDDDAAAAIVACWVEAIGFDPVHIGHLADSFPLEPGGALFGVATGREQFVKLWKRSKGQELGSADDQQG